MRLLPLIENLSIRTKDLRVVRLQPNWAQRRVVEEVEQQMQANRAVRIIVLKARQLGISTITEAIGYNWMFLHEGAQGMVVAHQLEPSQHLLSMTNMYWDTWPFKRLYQTKYESAKQLSWTMGSSMRITTASNVGAGRARTLHFLHASEVGFWPDPETTMVGLRQTIPDRPETLIMLESTANGVGNFFYNTWNAAEEGEIDYKPLFFPWHQHPEYLASAMNLPYHSLGHLDDEERALKSMGLSDDRLAWRRWAVRNLVDGDINMFHQEYPTTPEEAFISTGSNVFPKDKIMQCYEPIPYPEVGRLVRDGSGIRFNKDIGGPLRIFKYPSKDTDWGQYIVGGDPTHTTIGDFACAQVINRRTLEQVAMWRGKIDPASFGEELGKLGMFYNSALMVPELEGPGAVTVGKLLGMNYPNVWRHRRPDHLPGKVTQIWGWSTTEQSKQVAIGNLIKVLVDNSIKLHDPKTVHEMQNYVSYPNGGMGPGDGAENDDTVMALAIATAAWAMDAPLVAYGGGAMVTEVGGQTQEEPPWTTWGEDVTS